MKTRFDKQFSQKGMIIFFKTKQMKLSWKHFLTKLFPQKGMISFYKTKHLKIAFAVLKFSNSINNNKKL